MEILEKRIKDKFKGGETNENYVKTNGACKFSLCKRLILMRMRKQDTEEKSPR